MWTSHERSIEGWKLLQEIPQDEREKIGLAVLSRQKCVQFKQDPVSKNVLHQLVCAADKDTSPFVRTFREVSIFTEPKACERILDILYLTSVYAPAFILIAAEIPEEEKKGGIQTSILNAWISGIQITTIAPFFGLATFIHPVYFFQSPIEGEWRENVNSYGFNSCPVLLIAIGYPDEEAYSREGHIDVVRDGELILKNHK